MLAFIIENILRIEDVAHLVDSFSELLEHTLTLSDHNIRP